MGAAVPVRAAASLLALVSARDPHFAVPLLLSQSDAPQELALAQIKLRKTSTLLPPPSPEPPLTPEDHVIQPKLLVPSLKLPVIHPSLSDAPTELQSADLLLRPKLTTMPLPSPEPPLTPEDHAIPAKQPHTD